MGKTVIVVSKQEDIIKNDIDYLLSILKKEKTYVKKKKTAKSFSKLPLVADKLGLVWFCSSDYTNFINHIQEFKDYLGNIAKPVFEFDVESVDESTIKRFIEQYRVINDNFKLTLPQVYIKLNLAFMEDKSKDKLIPDLFSLLEKENIKVSRVQIDFSRLDVKQVRLIEIANLFTSLASKHKIVVSSCRCDLFSKKNIWIKHEPCISGTVMEEILGCKMVCIRHQAPPHKNCMCHKYLDILGIGERFTGEDKDIRKSDREKKLKKFDVDV